MLRWTKITHIGRKAIPKYKKTMKITVKKDKLRLCTILLAVTAISMGLFVSCTKDMDGGSTNRLADGSCPMIFTSTVSKPVITRITTESTWNGGEEIAIQVSGSEVKKYTVTDKNNGTLSSADPLYWQSTNDITVNAWHQHTYSSTKPTVIVKADQSIPANYQASDYLEAKDAIVKFNQANSLTFTHRTAKVIATLVKGTGITDIAGSTVRFVNLSSVENSTEIIPYNGNAALLAPQDMTGKAFIQVTLDGYTYSYTPTIGEADLQAGTQYTYTITVNKTGLNVSLSSSPIWTGDTENVTSH